MRAVRAESAGGWGWKTAVDVRAVAGADQGGVAAEGFQGLAEVFAAVEPGVSVESQIRPPAQS